MNITKLVELKLDSSNRQKFLLPHNWEIDCKIDQTTNYNYIDAYRYILQVKFHTSFLCDDSRIESFRRSLIRGLNYSLYGDLVEKLIQIRLDASNKNWPDVDDALSKLIDEYTEVK